MRLQNNKEKIGHHFRPGSKKFGYLTVMSVVIHNCKTKITALNFAKILHIVILVRR